MAQDGKEVGGEEDPPPEVIAAPTVGAVVCTYWREVYRSGSTLAFGAPITGPDAASLGGMWIVRALNDGDSSTAFSVNTFAVSSSGITGGGSLAMLPGGMSVSQDGLCSFPVSAFSIQPATFDAAATGLAFAGSDGGRHIPSSPSSLYGACGPSGWYRVNATTYELRVSGSSSSSTAGSGLGGAAALGRYFTGPATEVVGRWEIISDMPAAVLGGSSGGSFDWETASVDRQTYQQLLSALGVAAPVGSSDRSVRKSILGNRSVIWRNDVEQPSGETNRFWFKLPKLPNFPEVPLDGPVLPLRITIPALPGSTGPAWDFDEDLTFTWYKPIRPWVAAGIMILVCYACVARIFSELSGRGKDG